MSDAEIVRDVLTRATNETATKMLPVDVFLDASLALDRLESQNQALQEELATTQEAYRFKSREADANGREVENKAAILNAIEALLDVDAEHTGWDRIVALQERLSEAEEIVGKRALAVMKYGEPKALQERAEKAEAALRELAEALYDRRIYDNGIPQYEPTRNRKEVRLIHALNAARALSPTQETDELARGIVHDFGDALETLAKHDTRPTQETDPG